MPDGPVSEKGGVMELWDLFACCQYYQTGACSHTENYDNHSEYHEDVDCVPLPASDDQDSVYDPAEPF